MSAKIIKIREYFIKQLPVSAKQQKELFVLEAQCRRELVTTHTSDSG